MAGYLSLIHRKNLGTPMIKYRAANVRRKLRILGVLGMN
jgi:hypothetical protein